ncbi:hypothetical protein BCR42DRAFT_391247 [Absidia repens]|uniref:J domain-containing protein n=1 Tax=Absidia repens TaxID=90262 RepID=A0A1X2IJL6_9FUNG|nr:hypothetical protein BCR42DRAFT_391247 [Absidia repens]
MASLALLNSKSYYAYTMLGYGDVFAPITFKSYHQTHSRAYRCGYSFHPTRRTGSNDILNSLTNDIFQSVVISFIILSDPALKALYDKFGTLELEPFLKSLGMDCQDSIMAFCRGVWFSYFEKNPNSIQEKGCESLSDINSVSRCALSKITSTDMNYSIENSYSEQGLADDKLVMDQYKFLNSAHVIDHHPHPAEFIMASSLFGTSALYSAKLHIDPFSTLKFEQDEFITVSNSPKRSTPPSDDNDGDYEDNVNDDDIFMDDKPLAKRIKK